MLELRSSLPSANRRACALVRSISSAWFCIRRCVVVWVSSAWDDRFCINDSLDFLNVIVFKRLGERLKLNSLLETYFSSEDCFCALSTKFD